MIGENPWARMTRRILVFRGFAALGIPFYLLVQALPDGASPLWKHGAEALYLAGFAVAALRLVWVACPACGLPFYLPSLWNIARRTCVHCGVRMGSREESWSPKTTGGPGP